MTAFQWGNDIIIVDVGIGFPDEDMPGVDLIIPDFSWLKIKRTCQSIISDSRS